MKIFGNTSAEFKIDSYNGHTALFKTAHDDPGKRLIKQADKQKFGLVCDNVEPVEIWQLTTNNNATTIVMPYISSGTFIDFAERSSVMDIDNFATNIIKFVKSEMNEYSDCEPSYVDNAAQRMKQKLDEVRKKFDTYVAKNGASISVYKWYWLFDKANENINNIKDLRLIAGSCHGDLTLSNILFSGAKYYLIDYLDSYIESPMMDIIKLRQDTLHKWILQMTNDTYDSLYINIVLDYLDKRIQNEFSDCDWYGYYNIFAAINMFRILPYSLKDGITSKKVTYLYNEIEKLIG